MNKNHTGINGSRTNISDDESFRGDIHPSQSSILIKLPFPPIVNLFDLVSKKSPDGRIPARSPNAFIIYRKVYVETARKSGYFLPMTNISSMASQSWADESEVVRAEYQKIAKDALKVRNEVYPKSSKRKRKDKWNLVSFETPPPTARTIDRQKKPNKKTPSQAVKAPTKNLPLSASAPSIGPPSFEMTDSNPTSYESLIVNTNIANDQNRNLDVNNDPKIDNNISISTFMQNDITSFQEIIRHLNRTESSDPLNRDLNNEPSFKYDNSARNAQARVNSFTTLYIPPNILNVNSNSPTSSYANILNGNNMITPSSSPDISFSGDNMIHYYTPPIHSVDFTGLDSAEYSLAKD